MATTCFTSSMQLIIPLILHRDLHLNNVGDQWWPIKARGFLSILFHFISYFVYMFFHYFAFVVVVFTLVICLICLISCCYCCYCCCWLVGGSGYGDIGWYLTAFDYLHTYINTLHFHFVLFPLPLCWFALLFWSF